MGRFIDFPRWVVVVILVVACAGGVHKRAHADSLKAALSAEAKKAKLEERNKYDKQTKELRAQGKNAEALQAAQAMLAIEREVLGETHDEAIESMKTIANIHWAQQQWAASAKAWSEALALLTKKHGKDDWRVVDARWVVEKAELLTKLDDEGRREILEADKLSKQAADLYAQNKSEEALALGRKVLSIYKERQGERSADYLTALGSVGSLLRSVQKPDEALSTFQKGLEATEAVCSRPHPKISVFLDGIAYVLDSQGKLAEARDYLERSLKNREAVYTKELFPRGHHELAKNLYELGYVISGAKAYDEGRKYYDRSLAMTEALYPEKEFPQGHFDLMKRLADIGMQFSGQGLSREALTYMERAKAMALALYPKEKFPQGHADLDGVFGLWVIALLRTNQDDLARDALEKLLEIKLPHHPDSPYPKDSTEFLIVQGLLGTNYQRQGDFAAARALFEQSLKMSQQLYPRDKYPLGHSDVASARRNLGGILSAQGKDQEARSHFVDVLAMERALYPKDKFPQGSPEICAILARLGFVSLRLGNLQEGQKYLQEALALWQARYPQNAFPAGHQAVAVGLSNMGESLEMNGALDEAQSDFQQALAMFQNWYPRQAYPVGHRDLAMGLMQLGRLHLRKQNYEEARRLLEQAAQMYGDVAELFVPETREADALDYLPQLSSLSGYMTACALPLRDGGEVAYPHVWRAKRSVGRILHRRQESIRLKAGADPKVQQLVEAWNRCCEEVSYLTLFARSRKNSEELGGRLRQLMTQRIRLEQQLEESLPDFKRKQTLGQEPYDKLVEVLPKTTVVVDFVQYPRFEQASKLSTNQGARATRCYAGFVLAKNRPVQLVDLGPAQPIDDAVLQWRQAISKNRPSPSDKVLQRKVWSLLAKRFPPGIKTVVLVPDGLLTAIPWPALPSEKTGALLLEQFALATAPSASFVLEMLSKPPRKPDTTSLLLCVAGSPSELPGAAREIKSVSGLLAPKRKVELGGPTVTPSAVLRELPRVRWAHFATRGFFEDAGVRSALHPDPRPSNPFCLEEAAPLDRNPLALSGLLLGASEPSQKKKTEHPGLLSGKTVADLSLPNLDLVVLSACDTGLGTVADGEGVFELQRAFHLAGARSVVASLWDVPDHVTEALMAEFYANLWQKKLPAIEALRQAQLTLLKDRRWQERWKLVVPAGGDVSSTGEGKGRPPAAWWAGFALSGG